MNFKDMKKLKVGDFVKYKNCYYLFDYYTNAKNSDIFGENYTFKFSHSEKGERHIIHIITVYENRNAFNGNISAEDITQVSKDEFELSKIKYEEPKTVEELIKKFQKDLRNYQKEGELSYNLKIPFEGSIDVEVKRIIK